MATVIDNLSESRHYVEPERIIETDEGSGWAVAAIVLVALLAVGAYWWIQTQAAAISPSAPAPTTGSTINVTVPGSASPGVTATTSAYAPSLSGSSSASNTRTQY